MEDKYIDLLINKCMNFKKSKILFISYYTYNENFIQRLIKKLEPYNLKEIYLNCIDPFYEHALLQTSTVEEIEESGYFDSGVYDEYAKKNASFLIFVSPIPDLMHDIEEEKIALVSKIRTETRKVFVEKEISNKIPWSIVPLYNEYWEESLGINNLSDMLYDMLKIKGNPIKNWEEFIKNHNEKRNKLNELQLDYLVYKNSLGTNLKVGLVKNYKYEMVGDNIVLENMPSYEIFTSPNKYMTEGKVFSSRALYYNGKKIDEFYLEFKDGKVVDFDAKVGKDILGSIVFFDSTSCYLGEAALVEDDSPISQTKQVFKTTLIDENASCHLALGRGFGYGSKKKLEKLGINFSNIHVDFMIGTPDLEIIGYKDGKEIPVMKDGKFVI